MSYVNTNDSYGSYNKVTTTAGVYTYSYADLSLNSNVSDQDQILVLRKFTPTAEYLAADAPDGLNDIKLKGSESWEAWTLPSLLASGSDMYTINTDDKTITMSTDPTKYVWTRTIGSTTTTHNLPIFDGSSDELYFLRKTFAVTPFVSWQSGSRFTSTQLNNEVLQLINLCQEVLDRANKFDTLSPYYGSAEGICPLNSAGVVPEANLGPDTISTLLSGRTINTGDGLTGGGTLATDLTLGVVIDSTSLAVTSSGFKVNFNAEDFYLDGSGYLAIKIADDSITSSASGIKVSIQDNLTSSDTDKALSANQGVIMKASIDALDSGIRFLGSVTPAIQSTAVDAIDTTGYVASSADASFTISIPTSAGGLGGTAVTIALDENAIVPPSGSANTIHIGTYAGAETDALAASYIIAALNGVTDIENDRILYATSGNGEASDDLGITASQGSSDTQITLTMDTQGVSGNISSALASVSGVDIVDVTAFTGGTAQSTFPAAPGDVYATGDTVDCIANAGIVIDPDTIAHSVSVGDDLRKPAVGNWYIIPETVTFALNDYFRHDGTVSMSGDLNMGTTNQITLLQDPTLAQDAATKNYVDTNTVTQNYVDTSTVRTLGLLADVTMGTPSNGDIFAYNGAAWVNNSNIGNPQIWALTQTVAGTTNFALSPVSFATNVSTFIVSIDGLIQRPTTDYIIISSSEINFTSAPPINSEINIMNFGIGRNVTTSAHTANVKDYGAEGNGTTDDSVAIQAAMDSGISNVYLPSGTYRIDSTLTLPDDVNLQGDGIDITILDGSQATSSSLTGGVHIKTTDETLTALPDLSVDVTKMDTTLTFASAPTVSVGDVIFIYNPTDYSWASFGEEGSGSDRPYYRAGEQVVVAEISGSVVTIKGHTHDSYDKDDIDMYRLVNPTRCTLSDFTLKGLGDQAINGITYGIYLTQAVDSSINRVKCYNCTYSGITVKLCNSVSVVDCHVEDDVILVDGLTNGDYGLVISNSHNVTVRGGYYSGGRHGISTGGGDHVGCSPSRFITVSGTTITNTGAQMFAADNHGNIDYMIWDNCEIDGGIAIGGDNVTVSNCHIQVGDGTINECIYGAEFRGCSMSIHNNILENNGNYTSTGNFVNIGGSNLCITHSTTKGGTITITDNLMKYVGTLSDVDAIKLAQRGYTGDEKVNVLISRNTINNESLTTSADFALHIEATPDSDTAALGNWGHITISNNQGLGGIHLADNISATDPTIGTAEYITVTDNTLTDGQYGISLRGIKRIVNVSGNMIKDMEAHPVTIYGTDADNPVEVVNITNNTLVGSPYGRTSSSATSTSLVVRYATDVNMSDNFISHDYKKITVADSTGFVVGEVITGGSSGSTATVYYIQSNNLMLKDSASDNFTDSEALTSASASTTVNDGTLTDNRSYSIALSDITNLWETGNKDSTGLTYYESNLTNRRDSELISVKNYGAIGDGTTDDTVAIATAMDALESAGGGTLLFPKGVYAITERCVQNTCNNSFLYEGEDATIKCIAAGTLVSEMFLVKPGGYDFTISGLTFDADSKANDCLRVNSFYQDNSLLIVRDCNFTNSYTNTTAGNNGFAAYGGWDKVTIDNCSFNSHTRASGAGNPGSQGTSGCTVSGYTDGDTYFPRFVTVQNCHFEDILNGDTGTDDNNMDSDGLKIFGGNTTGTDYIASSSTVSNNVFRNCKGRSIKIQQDESTVIGNTFSRNILPIDGGFTDINMQVSSGEASSNKFHYDEVTGTPNLSPFEESGAGTDDSTVIGFYSGDTDERPSMVTVSNNTVYNNVDPAIGILGNFIGFSTGGDDDYDHDRILTATNNKATGKLDRFIHMSDRMGDGVQYVTAADNYVTELDTSFITMNAGGDFTNNYITLTGNVHSGTTVPAAWYPSGATVPQANYSVTNCVGLVADTTALGYLQNRKNNTFASRINALAPESSSGGLITILSATLADDATWLPPARGYFGYGALRILSVGSSENTTALFVDGNAADSIVDIHSVSGSVIFIDEGATETDGKINIWRDTTNDTIAIKNRLGSQRVFTLVTIG